MDEIRKVPVIIPAYEPDEKLLTLLGQLREAGADKLVVVDDGSGEAYAELFARAGEEHGAVVLTHAVNLGKGRALKTAFNECLQRFPDASGCITADSDGQHTTACILSCMRAMQERPEALVLGCRNFDQAGVPGRSSFGNKVTRAIFGYLTGVNITDTQTGLRGIPASFMRRLMNVSGERFEFETNMLLETKEAGVLIVEVPIQTVYLEENRGSHFHPIRDSVRIYRVFGKFLFSSLSSSAVDLVLFALFCSMLKKIEAIPLQFGYIATATFMARILSALYNFSVNYRVVFRGEAKPVGAALRYFSLAAVQMCASALFTSLLFGLIGGSELIVKIVVDAGLFLASFWIQREFVYKAPRKGGEKAAAS